METDRQDWKWPAWCHCWPHSQPKHSRRAREQLWGNSIFRDFISHGRNMTNHQHLWIIKMPPFSFKSEVFSYDFMHIKSPSLLPLLMPFEIWPRWFKVKPLNHRNDTIYWGTFVRQDAWLEFNAVTVWEDEQDVFLEKTSASFKRLINIGKALLVPPNMLWEWGFKL